MCIQVELDAQKAKVKKNRKTVNNLLGYYIDESSNQKINECEKETNGHLLYEERWRLEETEDGALWRKGIFGLDEWGNERTTNQVY